MRSKYFIYSCTWSPPLFFLGVLSIPAAPCIFVPYLIFPRDIVADGKCMACTYRVKFIEISVGINHNVDDLLVGILNQIRLKNVQGCAENRTANGGTEGSGHWYKSRGVVRASMKARQMLTWLFGKEDSKFKNCENLHVL